MSIHDGVGLRRRTSDRALPVYPPLPALSRLGEIVIAAMRAIFLFNLVAYLAMRYKVRNLFWIVACADQSVLSI
jgi:hypothetical protein